MNNPEIADLLIVGGGINGAGIARDAAGRGLKVVLCEQGDLGGATSSASSKLIHGGLRYLEYYEFRLVRESLAERETLLRTAPHIVWPLRFLLPHNELLRPAWMVRLGLFLYDHIGGARTLPGTRTVDLRRDPQGAPLKPELTRGFEYSDCWVEDSRLVVLNAMDAAARGAEVLVGTVCTHAKRVGAGTGSRWQVTLVDQATGAERSVTARILVNAAGPWVDQFLRTGIGRKSAQNLRLVKGSHIIVPRLYDGAHAYILQNDDKRVVFAIPYEHDYTLIGTTELAYDGDPGAPAIDKAEIDYLCTAVNRYLEKPVDPSDVVRTYSGVRPLFDDDAENPSKVTRDYVLEVETEHGNTPLLSVYGGKITTYRCLAEEALEKLEPHLRGLAPCWTDTAPLPGGDLGPGGFEGLLAELRQRHPYLPEALATRYARLYGSLSGHILEGVASLADLGEEFGAGLYEREAAYLVEHEWARTADDILWRRTKLDLVMPGAGRERLEAWLAERAAPEESALASAG
ncbi:MAG: glycerol-3-phosphate dehydrogenase [Inquilinus sp.]|nr:glycerol-3-phosphate dehydrogenase [Inquilinus sp.]